jgi:hypothetical protein
VAQTKVQWLLLLASSISLAGFTRAEEWPQYRGPKGDGFVGV